MGKLGLFGLTSPEEYGGAGEDGDFTSLCVAIEEIGRVDQSMGITLEAAVGLGHQPDPHLRHRRAEADLAARPGGRPDARRLRAHRAGRRLRRGRHQDQGRAGRGRVGGQRRQAVHHQLRLRDHQRRRGDRPHRRSRTGDKPELSAILVPAGTAGFTAEKPYDKLGWHASDTHPLILRGLPGARGQPARRPGPRLRAVPRHPRRRPGRDRRARGRLHPGLPRPERSSTPASGRRSAYRSGASRGWPSRSPTSR